MHVMELALVQSWEGSKEEKNPGGCQYPDLCFVKITMATMWIGWKEERVKFITTTIVAANI